MNDAYESPFDQSLVKVGPMDVDVYPAAYPQQYAAMPLYPSNAFPSFQATLYGSDSACFIEPLDIPRRPAPMHTYSKSKIQPPSPPPARSRSIESESEDEEAEEIDTSTMTKEQLRKHKNRQSAARSRKRSRNRMEELEQMVERLSAKNRRLEEQVQALLMERDYAMQQQHLPHMAPMHPSSY